MIKDKSLANITLYKFVDIMKKATIKVAIYILKSVLVRLLTLRQ
ncbi:hypothetical protein THOB06_50110 [Vibrio rotiferianus]|nr:hypothetical protein THOG10_50110 [Vibrio rotiferianus]CAH1591302.1 hypothetical protein THOB06_50110 [Vibrio rotiferianus]